VISLFYETKIPTVDMKVQVYSDFRKNKIWKKTKSSSSMRNGRFYTPKCGGKVHKIGVLYTHFAKCQGHPQRTPQRIKKTKKIGKRGPGAICARLRAATSR
jgi:hypothetical protein